MTAVDVNERLTDQPSQAEALGQFIDEELSLIAKARDASRSSEASAIVAQSLDIAEISPKEPDFADTKKMTQVMQELGAMREVLAPGLLPKDEEGEKPIVRIPTASRVQLTELAMQKIYWELCRACLDRSCSMSSGAGYKELLWHEAAPYSRSLVAKTASRNIRLNFLGPLSLVPSIGSFRICSFDGFGIVMRSNCAKGPICDAISPA